MAVDCTLTVGDSAAERTINNLSLGGCHIVHDVRIGIGTRVSVSFRIPTHEDPIEVGGAVRWGGDEGAGVQFDGLRAKEVWALNKFFENMTASASIDSRSGCGHSKVLKENENAIDHWRYGTPCTMTSHEPHKRVLPIR